MGLSDGHKALLGRKEGELPVSGCEGTRGASGQGFKVSWEFFILIRSMEVSGERAFDREGSEEKGVQCSPARPCAIRRGAKPRA